jgi:hypothetical protein
MVTRLAADCVTLDRPPQDRRRGSQARARGRRSFRTVGVFGRPQKTDLGYRPLAGAPDQVENDYYRFLNQPRD